MPTRLSASGLPLEPLGLGGKRLGIGLRLSDLLGDGVGVVGEIDARHVGLVRLRHLLRAVAQAHHARGWAGDQRLGQREEAAVIAGPRDGLGEVVVELLRDVAGKLEMLLLVLAHGNVGRVIEQNVGGHQVRIDVEAG